MKIKILLVLLAILLVIPLTSAEEENEEDNSSWLEDLSESIIHGFFEFVLKIFNAPISLLLLFVKKLMTAQVKTALFNGIWSIMVYIVSIFYGLAFLYSGFNFLISGYDPVKREKAKSMLKNVIIMIILVQASSFIYTLILEFGSLLTSGVMDMINPDFFILTADNSISFGLDLIFVIPYALILLLTSILLILRYVIVSVGIALFPLGIFLFFFHHTKTYGRVIINCILINIFITFFCAIFLLAFAKIIELPIFSELKIIVMICSFLCVDFLILFSFQIAKGDSFKQRTASAGNLATSALKKVI